MLILTKIIIELLFLYLMQHNAAPIKGQQFYAHCLILIYPFNQSIICEVRFKCVIQFVSYTFSHWKLQYRFLEGLEFYIALPVWTMSLLYVCKQWRLWRYWATAEESSELFAIRICDMYRNLMNWNHTTTFENRHDILWKHKTYLNHICILPMESHLKLTHYLHSLYSTIQVILYTWVTRSQLGAD